MKRSVKSYEIKGVIDAPPSKSMLQRLLAVSHLSRHPVRIAPGYLCRDSKAALDVIRALGSIVTEYKNEILIKNVSPPKLKNNILNCREAGLCLRMFSPLASLFAEKITLKGEGSLLKRPVNMITEPLRSLGIEVSTNKGYLPVEIKGPLQGGIVQVDGSISSQFLTGLLIALPVTVQDSTVCVKNLKSKPYIDMTLKVLKDFKIKISRENYTKFFIQGMQSFIPPKEIIKVEGDWSGAAFMLVAGAVAGEITVKGLDPDSTQADRSIITALQRCGAKIEIKPLRVKVTRGNLKAFEFDATDCPDLIPPLAALASHCTGTSLFQGVSRLLHKESNRSKALMEVFGKMGIKIKVEGDSMKVTGGFRKFCTVKCSGDHRIAMAAAVGGIGIKQGIEIEGSDCINKSYPRFFKDFNLLGGQSHE